MDNNMLKLNKKKWYKIEIITIHVQHAGLIFLMQIFVFFLYNRAGNKTDDICAQNVLTEARVSGLRASVLRTLDRQVPLSFLPRLAPARRPGSLFPQGSLPGLEVAAPT